MVDCDVILYTKGDTDVTLYKTHTYCNSTNRQTKLVWKKKWQVFDFHIHDIK